MFSREKNNQKKTRNTQLFSCSHDDLRVRPFFSAVGIRKAKATLNETKCGKTGNRHRHKLYPKPFR